MAAHRQPAASDRDALIASLLSLLDSLPEAATVTVQTLRGPVATFIIPALSPCPPTAPKPTIPIREDDERDTREDILSVLKAAGRRLTTAKILTDLNARGWVHGETTVKRRLAEMVDDGWLDNDPKDRPPGYGLTTV